LNSVNRTSQAGVSLVVLAAGLGRRFGGGKQLAGVDDSGRPLMYYSILDAWRAGIDHLVVIVSESMKPLITAQLLPLLPDDLKVDLAIQSPDSFPDNCPLTPRKKPWGTAHALWCAREYVRQPFIVINADDYYGRDALSQMVEHFRGSNEWAIICYALGRTLSEFGGVNRGLCEIAGDYLLNIQECLSICHTGEHLSGKLENRVVELTPDSPVSMNLWGFTPEIFSQLASGLQVFALEYGEDADAELYLPNQVLAAIAAGRCVRAYHTDSEWRGITYPEDLAGVAAEFQIADKENY
jgi:NDP-sugar pyrophosphorylase family protein